MTIKEIESRTGLPRANIRFYEREGLLSPGRGENGYRDYSEEDCQTLLKIKLLRQVGCSLEEIRALQGGSCSMDSVLKHRLQELETSLDELSKTKQLCRQLWEDQVEWSTMQPEQYLSQSPAPLSHETVDIRFRIPWRRFFARGTDFALYSTIWAVFLALCFRVNIMQRSTGGNIIDTTTALMLMLILEPIFLHRFGTTPGKAIFGLRLTRSDGSCLSFSEAFQRTGKVILLGDGCMIPLVSLAANIYGYYCCRKEKKFPWSAEDEAWSDGTDGRSGFWALPKARWRVLGFLAIRGLFVLVLLGAFLFASVPRYRGELTVEQFSDNYNHLSRFSSAPDTPARLLNSSGQWIETDPNGFVIQIFGDGPHNFQFTKKDGVISRICFSYQSLEQGQPVVLPSTQPFHTVNALLGKGEFLPSKQRETILRELLSSSPGTHTWTIDGWNITQEIQIEGYLSSTTGYLFPQEKQVQYLNYQFIMERT